MTEIEKAAKDYCISQPKWLAATVEAAFEMGAIWATERAAKVAEELCGEESDHVAAAIRRLGGGEGTK